MKCPVCEKNSYELVLRSKDYFYTGKDFDIYSCNYCGLRITWPQPEPDELSNYYKTEEYLSHGNKSKSLFSFLYCFVRKISLGRKYGIIKKYTNKGSILDYGCGTGEFLKYCKKKSLMVTGVEPNDKARKISENKNGIKCYKRFSCLSDHTNKYDVISLWHVLEHIPNLRELISALANTLKKDGVLIIALPNFRSHDAKLYKKYWAGYDLPRHLFHFNRKTLTQLLKIMGFKLIEIKPMKFDAYYVSILSEKYKKNQISFVKGMFFGWRSNIKALQNGEFSSLIYIFKKKQKINYPAAEQRSIEWNIEKRPKGAGN